MQVAATLDELEKAIGNPTHSRCGFVPTMGALHEGHLELIRRAVTLGSRPSALGSETTALSRQPTADSRLPVVVSIFVNPTQFGPGEDFQKYPRTLEADVEAAELAGADIVFVPPGDKTIYPPDVEIPVPELPGVATQPGLEDAHRPGHFAGVCQVVARLFDLVKPAFAVFGEKDYQQLLVIKAMVRQEGTRWPGLEIIAHPTLRDADGLALSSRNRFLSASQRERALAIPRALEAASAAATPAHAESIMRDALVAGGLTQIDYAVVRDARTLMPIEVFDQPARALIAARVDDVRLIDNRGCTTASAENTNKKKKRT